MHPSDKFMGSVVIVFEAEAHNSVLSGICKGFERFSVVFVVDSPHLIWGERGGAEVLLLCGQALRKIADAHELSDSGTSLLWRLASRGANSVRQTCDVVDVAECDTVYGVCRFAPLVVGMAEIKYVGEPFSIVCGGFIFK